VIDAKPPLSERRSGDGGLLSVNNKKAKKLSFKEQNKKLNDSAD
jgi:hypothetical protein